MTYTKQGPFSNGVAPAFNATRATAIDQGIFDLDTTLAALIAGNATESVSGLAQLSTQAEADAGTDDATIMTPLKVATRPQKSSVFETHIEGLRLTWTTPGNNGNLISVSSGAAWIQSLGRIYNVSSTITGPTQSLSASAHNYVYLYDNSGTPAIEITTTAPAAAYKGDARSKTADTSRRYLGQVLTGSGGTPVAYSFKHSKDDWVIYDDADPGIAPFVVINAVAPAAEATQSLVAVMPPNVCTSAYVGGAITNSVATGLNWVEFKTTTTRRVAETGSSLLGTGAYHIFTIPRLPVIPATPSIMYLYSGTTSAAFTLRCYGYHFAR